MKLNIVVAGKQHKRQIQLAVDDWNKFTCLRFRPANMWDENYLVLQDGNGYASNFISVICDEVHTLLMHFHLLLKVQ